MKTNNIKILLLEGVHPNAVEHFEKMGYSQIEYVSTSISEAELVEKVKDVHILGIRSRTHVTEDVLKAANELLCVGCFCIGTNQVDTTTAQLQGIPVFNAPFSNTRSVAELTMASIIHLMRGVPEKNIAAHKGVWKKSAKNSFEVRKKNLGIVGYGNIGSQVSIIASALGMHVYYYDIENKLPHGNARAVDSLEELLSISDVVTLHVPETDDTANMMNAAMLNQMKEGSCLINYSRGNVVDIDVLSELIKSGKLLGAAIDVFPEEPESTEEPFRSPLQTLDNVLLTPHIGGSTQEAQENIGVEVAEKMIKYHQQGVTSWAVNFPDINAPEKAGGHRIVHTHTNQPGILGKIMSIVSSRGVNILGQQLQTSVHVGYVVIDIESTSECDAILTDLQEIEGTIKTRLLY